jgi:hypothetical protein
LVLLRVMKCCLALIDEEAWIVFGF